MKKEEQLSQAQNCPIGIFFIPLRIVIPFEQKLKLQIAFYRGNKVCKTKPSKYTKSETDSHGTRLDQEKLNFCTTIRYFPFSHSFETKKVDVQLALNADGKKEELQATIDLKDLLLYQVEFQNKNLSIHFSDKIRLIYRIEAKFSEGLPALKQKTKIVEEQDRKMPRQKSQKKQRKLQFAEQVEQQYINGKNTPGRSQTLIASLKQNTNEKNNALSNRSNKNDYPKSEIGAKLGQIDSEKEQERNKKLASFKKQNQRLLEVNKKLSTRIKEFQEKYQTSQSQLAELQKLNKQLLKQKKQLIAQKNGEKDAEKNLEKKMSQIRKLEGEIQKHQAKETQFMKKMDEFAKVEQQLRDKYQESQRKNIKTIEELANSNYQLEKLKKDIKNLQQKIELLHKEHIQQVNDLQQRFKQNNLQTEGTNSHAKEMDRLKKDLQKKEELIRILGQSKEYARNQAKHEQQILKKEISQLREELERSSKKTLKDCDSGSDLELKISNEKLKRQFEKMKRMEKSMLMEKSSLKTQNESMEVELIKQKQTIAKMLNIIQEESQDLFTMVIDCIS